MGNLFAVTEVMVIMATIYRKYSPRKDLAHKIRYRKPHFLFFLQSHRSLRRIGADPCLPLDDIMMYFDPIDEEGSSSSSSSGWSPAKPKREKEKQKEEPKDVIEKVGF